LPGETLHREWPSGRQVGGKEERKERKGKKAAQEDKSMPKEWEGNMKNAPPKNQAARNKRGETGVRKAINANQTKKKVVPKESERKKNQKITGPQASPK